MNSVIRSRSQKKDIIFLKLNFCKAYDIVS
jgi:hypothetical protein